MCKKVLEFRDYLFSAPPVFCRCKFSYKLRGHKCDKNLFFERVVSILKIFIDSVSFLSQNVSLIIQMRRFLLLNGGMYHEFVHIDQ
jgi:hypothetical protein